MYKNGDLVEAFFNGLWYRARIWQKCEGLPNFFEVVMLPSPMSRASNMSSSHLTLPNHRIRKLQDIKSTVKDRAISLTSKTAKKLNGEKLAEKLSKQLKGIAVVTFANDQLRFKLSSSDLDPNVLWNQLLTSIQLDSGIQNLNYDPSLNADDGSAFLGVLRDHVITQLKMISMADKENIENPGFEFKPLEDLCYSDYHTKQIIETQNQQGFVTRFCAYFPKAFKKIRHICEIKEEDICLNLEGQWSLDKGFGKSGAQIVKLDPGHESIFVKTVFDNEIKKLQELLPSLIHHFETTPQSLLSVFLGLYSLQFRSQKVTIMIMLSVFPLQRNHLSAVYDLKGSSINRSEGEDPNEKGKTFKDMDWIRHNRKIGLTASTMDDMLKVLSLDTEYLVDNSLMDYSLLVAVQEVNHSLTIEEQLPSIYDRFSTGVVAWDARLKKMCIFYFGIIDILQAYNFRKISERVKNVVMYQTKASQHSCVDPKSYGDRFLKFAVEQIFFEQINMQELSNLHTHRRLNSGIKTEHFSPTPNRWLASGGGRSWFSAKKSSVPQSLVMDNYKQ